MSIGGFSSQCKTSSMIPSGMGMGKLADPSTTFKRKFRWMFRLLSNNNIIGEGINALPPLKGGRPSLEFKDIEVQHVVEDVYLPGKPSWKPVNFILYDTCPPSGGHPIWEWILNCYNPSTGEFYAILDAPNGMTFKQNCVLELYTGCGDVMERWTFENAWPSQVNWGDLDMSDGGVVTCDITLKYDRATFNKFD